MGLENYYNFTTYQVMIKKLQPHLLFASGKLQNERDAQAILAMNL